MISVTKIRASGLNISTRSVVPSSCQKLQLRQTRLNYRKQRIFWFTLLNPRKATGVDGVPAWLLKRFHEELAPVANDIIFASIEQSKHPTSYKHALVSPVPKVDNPTDINNEFRQISVLLQVAKVLERIQLKLNLKDLSLNASQHAFTGERSNVTALASIRHDWYNATDSGSPYNGVHVVFVDFRKAFDSVDHGVLLTKLGSMGITKSFWKWAQSYLSGRTQQAKLPGVLSRHGEVIAGVPRAVSFLLHFLTCKSTISRTAFPGEFLYPLASMLVTAPYMNLSLRTVSQMQDAVTHLESWAVQTDGAKCSGSPSRSPVQLHLLLVSGLPNWRELESLNCWVCMCRTISSGIHIFQVLSAKRVKRIHHLRVYRTAHLPRDISLTTYITKIRPVLEYASPVWGGLPIYLEEDLKRVQNRCLNVIGLPRDTVESLLTRRQKLTRKEFKRIPESEAHPCTRFLDKALDHGHNLRSCKANPAHITIPASCTVRHNHLFLEVLNLT